MINQLSGRTDIDGLEFDFNWGARIKVPEGNWRVKIFDRDTAVTMHDVQTSNNIVTSTKKYYINFRLEVYQDDKLVFEHNLDLKGKKVLLKYFGALGDNLAWFPYAKLFQERHNCKVYCAMPLEHAALFTKTYPDLQFIGPDERPDGLYASYNIGIGYPYDDRTIQPVDYRIVGLQKFAAYLLGLPPIEVRPKIVPTKPERLIKEPYVCIASQSTAQAKYWNNPIGWLQTIAYLKDKGYRVLCIDKYICVAPGISSNTIPYGAENFTGDIPLTERVNLLYYADFFIGLSSGLSWLAWATGRPVILISGFSLPVAEFYTPYRIINYNVCNGCFNDSRIDFCRDDFDWCPRCKNTTHQFECTRFITAEHVQMTIDCLMKDYGYNPKVVE
jgi:autotransporter strand-loop-strand O-heptosyltransferase